MVPHETRGRQNRRHHTEKGPLILLLSVPHPPSLRQPIFPPSKKAFSSQNY
jgi:hypothetical protein